MDLSYQFAASSFVTVLRKVIALCSRISSNSESSKVFLSTKLPASLSSGKELAKRKESYVGKLRNRQNDEAVLSKVWERTISHAEELLKSTKKQYDYVMNGGKASSTEEEKESKEVPKGQSEGNEDRDKTVDRPPHLRLVEEVSVCFLRNSINYSLNNNATLKYKCL